MEEEERCRMREVFVMMEVIFVFSANEIGDVLRVFLVQICLCCGADARGSTWSRNGVNGGSV